MTAVTDGWRAEDAPPEAEVERLAREILISREAKPEAAYNQAERFLRYHDDCGWQPMSELSTGFVVGVAKGRPAPSSR